MDIAVLSDIHGNYVSLQSCIDYALKRDINTFFFLGDYLGELPYPEKTMDIIFKMKSQYNCFFIKGNKEDYWLNYKKGDKSIWKENNSTTGSLLYTYSHLREKDIEFFSSLEIVQLVKLNEFPQITICHGSPNKTTEKMSPDAENTFEIMKKDTSDYILCGHTHIQRKIKYENKILLNGGSIGVPLHSDGKAQFLILHGIEDSWIEEFVSLDYDREKIIRDLHESKLDIKAPYWCKITELLLLTGEVSHRSVLIRAMDLCKEDTGNCIWPNIPERYWEQAVNEMINYNY